ERPPGERGEEGAVGDAVAGGVEHRAERGAPAAGPCHRAVHQVEQHEQRDDERADEQLAAGQEPQRRRYGARGARHGDGVRRDPARDEPPAERLGDAVDVHAGDDVEHVLLLVSDSPPAYPDLRIRPGHASASNVRVSDSSCGMVFVWPITAMKLASPPQRGTTCWWRWAASDPPATAPRFMPTLNAC